MDKRAERDAKKRLKGKIWRTPVKVHLRRPQWRSEIQEVETGHIPPPENPDGWNPDWGKRPGSWWDPELAYHQGDWEWKPGKDWDKKRAQIRGRYKHAQFQIDLRDERRSAEDAVKRVLTAEMREQQEVWRTWVLRDVRLTAKQRAFLTGEVELSRSARTHLLERVHDRTRRQLENVN